VWPHAVLAGHAHNYQRYTRHRSDGTDIPYLICGNGGHNVQKLQATGGRALRTPQTLQAKSADDSVTIDLATRRQTVYIANDLGRPAQAAAIQAAQQRRGR
jgi:hypothetical protein